MGQGSGEKLGRSRLDSSSWCSGHGTRTWRRGEPVRVGSWPVHREKTAICRGQDASGRAGEPWLQSQRPAKLQGDRVKTDEVETRQGACIVRLETGSGGRCHLRSEQCAPATGLTQTARAVDVACLPSPDSSSPRSGLTKMGRSAGERALAAPPRLAIATRPTDEPPRWERAIMIRLCTFLCLCLCLCLSGLFDPEARVSAPQAERHSTSKFDDWHACHCAHHKHEQRTSFVRFDDRPPGLPQVPTKVRDTVLPSRYQHPAPVTATSHRRLRFI